MIQVTNNKLKCHTSNTYTHTHLRNNITNTMMITISNTASMTPTTPPIIGSMEGEGVETVKQSS